MYYRNDLRQRHHFCDTLYGCYKVALGYGLRNGDGVSDSFNHTVEVRWVLDVSYYFIVNVGMLNLVAGVIITTFGQLRENQARIMEDTLGVCFICNIERQVFDRASTEPEGFKTHIKVDHNMWNYLYFIFMLWEQDKDDDDGLEQYVRRAIDANEISWFPLNKAIRLDQAASAEDSLMNDLRKSIMKSEGGVAGKLEKFQTNINVILEQLNQTLKQDHVQDSDDASRQGARRVRRPSLTGTDLPSALSGIAGATGNKGIPAVPEISWRQGKTLVIELVDISGISIPRGSYDRIICNVMVSTTFQQVQCSAIEKQVLTFGGENKFKLLENVLPADERTCVVQLFSEVAKPYNMTEIEAINIPVNDLMLAEGCSLEVFFQIGGVGPLCKLTVIPSCVGVFL